MKREYPKYRQGEIEEIYKKLPKTEQKIINEFYTYCGINAQERKQKDMRRNIIQFRNIIECSFDKITLNTLREYLTLLNKSGRTQYTLNGQKTHIKKFLKWKFKNWSDRFEELRDIRINSNPFNEEKINEHSLLKKSEIKTIMEKEHNLRKKTFFITLYESGVRPFELAKLKWSDISFNVDSDISEIHIYSTKTGKSRKVFVKESTFYLNKLRGVSFSEYVFPSSSKNHNPISKASSWRWIKEMSKYIDNKKVFPYLLRHTRSNELYGDIPSKVAQKFLGHKKDMSELYAQISSKKVKEKMKEIIYNIEELPQETKEDIRKQINEFKETFDYFVKVIKENPDKKIKDLYFKFPQ